MTATITQDQLAAIQATDRNVCLIAGAGSGKTFTVARRVARLIAEGVAPQSILLLTFTRKAAIEIIDRIAGLVGHHVARWIWAGTFHSISYRILREWGERIGYQTTGGAQISVITPEESEAIWREVAKLYRWNGTQKAIEQARAALAHDGTEPADPNLGRMIRAYWARLRESNAVDFDQLLLEVHRLFRECPDALAHYRHRFAHVIVDEYQDTDREQFRLHDILVGDPATQQGHGGSLFVVGDPRQAIYGWRGATVDIILGFQADHPGPGTRVLPLRDCFRCAPEIVEAANALIANNPEGAEGMISRTDPGRVEVLAGGAREVAAFIADELVGCRPDQTAVIARTHRCLEYLEAEIAAMGLPVHRVGAGGGVEKSATWREFHALLRCFANPRDGIAWSTALPWFGLSATQQAALLTEANNIGGTMMQALLRTCLGTRMEQVRDMVGDRNTGAVAALFDLARGPASGQAPAWPDLQAAAERIAMLGGEETSCVAWLERLAIRDMHAELESKTRAGSITLITAHSAKGLEWDTVIIADFDEGALPGQQSVRAGHVDEERRLAYVAMTRARRRLVMFTRKEPSRFITEAGLPCPQVALKGVAA